MSRQQLARVALLIGAALVVGLLQQKAPREQEISLRLEGSRDTLTGMSFRLMSLEGDEEGGATHRFGKGKAPPVVRGRMRVVPGRYRLEVSVEQGGGGGETVEKWLQLTGEPVQVPIRVGGE